MKELNQWTVHRAVEWLRYFGDFDAADVEDDVETVLRSHGFSFDLDEAGRERFRRELLPQGLARELAEVSRQMTEPEAAPWG